MNFSVLNLQSIQFVQKNKYALYSNDIFPQDPKGKDSKEEEKHDKTKKKEKDDKAPTKKGMVIISWQYVLFAVLYKKLGVLLKNLFQVDFAH